ncbi:MAG: cation-translocating P-type ATPase [Oscillatoriales cyanobacterium RM2_1_1]|nr:cation-translocating P-type ATPase [Oscillatoriales cyanobacterium RM2_1_1]
MSSSQPSQPSQMLNSSSLPQLTWHSLSSAEVCQGLQVDPNGGLTSEQVSTRQDHYGINEIEMSAGRQPLEILWEQFTNIMLVMLMAVAVISAILDFRSGAFPKDAIAIFVIVLLNGFLGFFQESRAEKALAALKQLSAPQVRVLRSQQILEIESRDLVPGDIIFLEAGVQIPADGRLLDSQNLQIREATLTGEAAAVTKQAGATLAVEVGLADRINMVFQGTEVLQGRGQAVLTETAMNTELGRIAALLQSVESEPTPLQQRMTQLGNVLVSGSLTLVALVVVGGLIRTGGFQYLEELLEVSLSMAVAVVPEGLPAVVTVTLAIGTQRMVKRHALIRKLPAVETLGSVTTICSDKTGTLTQNKMVIRQIATADGRFSVTGEGYGPWGEIQPLVSESVARESLTAESSTNELLQTLHPLLMAGTLCNDAQLQSNNDQWSVLGDPTEGAFLSLAGKVGIFKHTWEQQLPRVAEIPFTSERKRMSVACQVQDPASNLKQLQLPEAGFLGWAKGSPELILERCDRLQIQGQSVHLEATFRQHILEHNDQMAAQGLRVIGLAYKPLTEKSLKFQDRSVGVDGTSDQTSDQTLDPALELEQQLEHNLVWLGLVGMLDAPRPEVKEAVKRCRAAGIQPIMITGDHQLTATAIAHQLGIAAPGDPVLTGQQLQQMSPADLEQQVKQVSIYARVAPEHKLRIVQAFQRRGEFVAMTGDGVNDAPALKQADIGIAMGIMGTDVSKEASDMILLDDNFATIVAATEEGRIVYDNIRRFVKYILGSNIGEVITIAAAPILGLGGSPLTPLQILWMNLVTDGLPALALAMEPAEPQVMQRPPYNPRESIFARGLGLYMVRIGLIFSILTIILMVLAYGESQATGHPDRWKTMVFTTLCLAQMGHALAVRSSTKLTIQMNPFSNPYLLSAVTLTTVLQLMLIYLPPLREFFGTQILNMKELGLCLGFSSLIFVWIELEKLIKKWVRMGHKS